MSLQLSHVVPTFRRFARAASLAPLWWAAGAWVPMAASAGAGPSAGSTSPMAAAAPAPRSAYAGPWQVRQVLVDERRTDRLLYQVDDPRLVGRTLAIGPQRLAADLPDATACEQPGLLPEQQPLDTLLARTMQPELPVQHATRQFDAKLPGERAVDLAWITCKAGTFGPALKNAPRAASAAAGSGTPGGTWLALLPSGDALMPWHGHTLLVLQRQAPAAAVTPSFACTKARLPAEKAICASAALASYDRSLAQGWTYTVQFCDGDTDCIAEARQAQKQWVAQRNRCGSDQACLHKTMRERLDALMTPSAD
ncbi:MAG: hypothetical protein EOP38_22655 [Rubrivivax sp.]|nr:MAG: hypothetical protein EOP38_22655 [Rubrivivax sp.]